ncbi:MAG: hypothetical protein DHS20C01_05030 [marine bacterium B5-7]|nr:MAG: hypothetical protein DHS20C01_05030 [marine bacterium B5-7]
MLARRITSIAGGLLALFASNVFAAASDAVDFYLAGDYDRARKEWSELANGGDVHARYNLGMLYLDGLGVPRQPTRAMELISEAAVAGYAPAQYRFAMIKLDMDAVAALEMARFWLTNAARQGYPRAALELGRIYLGVYGGEQDQVRALTSLDQAASAGIIDAQEMVDSVNASLPGGQDDDELAVAIIKEGRGTLEQRKAVYEGQKAFIKQDYARAVEIWAPLAEAGVARAQYGIAFMLESGWGVVQDYREAAYWYARAAQQGHRKAQFNLGIMYLEGRGLEANRGIGLYWVQTASDLGEPRALEYMTALKDH